MYLVAEISEVLSNGSALIGVPDHEIVENMLEKYTSNEDPNEKALLDELYFTDLYGTSWVASRMAVKDMLLSLTPGRFYSFDKFDEWARLTHGNFMSSGAGGCRRKDEYNQIWEQCESRALEAFLCCYCAMGIIDLSFRESTDAVQARRLLYGAEAFVFSKITALRLTQLGAYVFGMESSYQPQSAKQATESGLVVTPDFCAILTGPKSQIEHAPFLSQFMGKPSTAGNAASYKLDFMAFAKALDQGITGEDIKLYLTSNSSKPLPENVLRTLDDWIGRSDKIRIRTVTLVEADDKYLIAEMASLTGAKSCMYKPLKHVAQIGKNEVKAFRKLLVKNGKYARMDDES
jgi:hypothetical protein